MRTLRLSVAAATIEFLKNQYVSRDGEEHRLIRAFAGIFGHGNVAGLGAAIEERGNEIPFIQPKNEQGMVHMAAAFAKTVRRLGTIACTTSVGPGATNMITGAAGATINRLPVLLLPGDVFATRIPSPVLQELESRGSLDVSVNDCFRPVSRYWDRIHRPEQLLRALPEAMRILASPVETGAVTICFPEDVQAEAWDFPAPFFERRVHAVPRPVPAALEIAEAAARLRSAARPFLIAGGGVHYADAAPALAQLVERTGYPVGVTQAGKGALLDSDPHCLGGVGATGTLAANEIAKGADLVIAVGTRLSDFTTASKTLFQSDRVSFVSVQIDPYDAYKHGAFPLVGDAKLILEELGKALEGSRVSSAYAREIAEAKARWEAARREILSPKREGGEGLTQAEVIRIVNEQICRDTTIVHAAGGLPGDLHKLWHCRDGRDFHSEYGYSCMGYEIAGALGVKLAWPSREVIALVGDGSYLMMHSELVTSLQEGIKITVILVDNGGYQCIHGLQRACGGQSFGNEFRRRIPGNGRLAGETLEIDYAANARSLGALGMRAESEGELVSALGAAREASRSVLIHVPVEPGAPIPSYAWWDVPMSEESASASVREARKRYDEARAAQRFHY
jgi:3D-(3,5/4)-trihydroxycyclohexane-1,2-dione acylhydrolase (decyclizing)